jgi:hypothetical protein
MAMGPVAAAAVGGMGRGVWVNLTRSGGGRQIKVDLAQFFSGFNAPKCFGAIVGTHFFLG